MKISGKILGSKRRDRPKPKLFLDSFVRGAIIWEVQVLVMVSHFFELTMKETEPKFVSGGRL